MPKRIGFLIGILVCAQFFHAAMASEPSIPNGLVIKINKYPTEPSWKAYRYSPEDDDRERTVNPKAEQKVLGGYHLIIRDQCPLGTSACWEKAWSSAVKRFLKKKKRSQLETATKVDLERYQGHAGIMPLDLVTACAKTLVGLPLWVIDGRGARQTTVHQIRWAQDPLISVDPVSIDIDEPLTPATRNRVFLLPISDTAQSTVNRLILTPAGKDELLGLKKGCQAAWIASDGKFHLDGFRAQHVGQTNFVLMTVPEVGHQQWLFVTDGTHTISMGYFDPTFAFIVGDRILVRATGWGRGEEPKDCLMELTTGGPVIVEELCQTCDER